jgi:hypothetical protein
MTHGQDDATRRASGRGGSFRLNRAILNAVKVFERGLAPGGLHDKTFLDAMAEARFELIEAWGAERADPYESRFLGYAKLLASLTPEMRREYDRTVGAAIREAVEGDDEGR